MQTFHHSNKKPFIHYTAEGELLQAFTNFGTYTIGLPPSKFWTYNLRLPLLSLRASPPVQSMWLQTVKFIVKKSKCAGLAQEIGFFTPNSSSLPWLVKGVTQLCTSRKEGNKLDLTAAQYFLLVDHNDWSRWFSISSSHVYEVPVTVLLVGLPKKQELNLYI